ncbi:MAG: hypothetical protein HRT53_17495 [Colwellia sp.]|nr:hypothetical protein [Colwellia sp.]
MNQYDSNLGGGFNDYFDLGGNNGGGNDFGGGLQLCNFATLQNSNNWNDKSFRIYNWGLLPRPF